MTSSRFRPLLAAWLSLTLNLSVTSKVDAKPVTAAKNSQNHIHSDSVSDHSQSPLLGSHPASESPESESASNSFSSESVAMPMSAAAPALPASSDSVEASPLTHSSTSEDPRYRNVKVITFDLYAALSDLSFSIIRNIHPLLSKKKTKSGKTITDKQIGDFTSSWFSQYKSTTYFNGFMGLPKVQQYISDLYDEQIPEVFEMMLDSTLEYALAATFGEEGSGGSVSDGTVIDPVIFTDEEKQILKDSWNNLDPLEGTLETLQELKRRGFKLAILSNGSEKRIRKVVEGNYG
jgi:FMN phosphatase YigB (HAD superfamily)